MKLNCFHFKLSRSSEELGLFQNILKLPHEAGREDANIKILKCIIVLIYSPLGQCIILYMLFYSVNVFFKKKEKGKTLP